MSKERVRRTGLAQEPVVPTFEQGYRASMMLADYYGETGQFGSVLEDPDAIDPLMDGEIARQMTELATGIVNGTVKSHREIAVAIQGFGPVIGPFGPTSPEVGDAAYRLAQAVYAHQGSLAVEPAGNISG